MMRHPTSRTATASAVLLGASLMYSGCATLQSPLAWFGSDKASSSSPAPTATTERTGRPERGSDPAEALYRLGLLQADPTSGIRDYRAARATFTRLLAEYPRSRWDAEARAWQATLTDLLLREDETRRALLKLQRQEEDSRRAKSDLERLKQTDLELERLRR